MTAKFLRGRWAIVAASTIGNTVSSGPINIFTFGVFLRPVSDSLGIGRRQSLPGVSQTLGQTIDPQATVRVEHDLDNGWVFQPGRNGWPQCRAQHTGAARNRFCRERNCPHHRPLDRDRPRRSNSRGDQEGPGSAQCNNNNRGVGLWRRKTGKRDGRQVGGLVRGQDHTNAVTGETAR